MKIGINILELRTAQSITPQHIANELQIPVEEYLRIENDEIDITLNQLEKISNVLSCSPVDLLQKGEPSGHIKNYFFNHDGNSGININVQGINQEEIRKSYKELYVEELKRIPKLEKLLRNNDIEFDF